MKTISFRRASLIASLTAVGVVTSAASVQAQTVNNDVQITADVNSNVSTSASALVIGSASGVTQAESNLVVDGNAPGTDGNASTILSQANLDNLGPTEGDIDDRIESSPPNPLNQTTPEGGITQPTPSPNLVQPQPAPGTTDPTFPGPTQTQPAPGTVDPFAPGTQTQPGTPFPGPTQTQPTPGTVDPTFPGPTQTQPTPGTVDPTFPEPTQPDPTFPSPTQQQVPDTTTPDTTVEPAIVPGTATRGGASYIGIGGNIGFGGETTLSEGAFAVYSKIGLTDTFSVRPAAYIGDNTVIAIPITADFPPAETGVADAQLNIAPYIGAGIAISTGEDSTVGALISGGVDVPLTEQFTATAGVNIGFIDDTEVGLLIGVGYNF
ncbi:hypothetical protein IQ230_01825 [Gloeocapsopsis crepidinum LEGE 06123]|uniref:Outer membrane protein beta-barrel domain-containing protein n=1 Tax=Gloeocapsopsis crepidinum LEGE 06123 TaxID=588587 RepID=A0ABR9ULF5_9CHRO|nr:hypothetical protein [Gloeocapsopsis crepidinum]MBE9189124.1 hypothetical protein [Gloeocapsopsis crepidinum LEGE 06123]